MTEADADAAHERYMEIAKAITKLVNEMTNGMTSAQDTLIRELLNDTQRYWRG
jgi:hypothetical protein